MSIRRLGNDKEYLVVCEMDGYRLDLRFLRKGF